MPRSSKTSHDFELTPVKFSRLSTRGVLFGLSGAQLACVGVAILTLATAGPIVVHETWTTLRPDTAHHTVLWISEWPRSHVFPAFLAPILLSSGIRRTFSLTCTPMRADQAARDIRRKKTEHIAGQAQRAEIGQIEDAATNAEYTDVLQQEADLPSGRGIIRYTGLITISADTPEQLQAAQAAIEQAAIQANSEPRPLVGQQNQDFTAAALPLCRAV